jgi:hypothetical protein
MLLALLVAVLAACGGDDELSQAETAAATPAAQPTVTPDMGGSPVEQDTTTPTVQLSPTATPQASNTPRPVGSPTVTIASGTPPDTSALVGPEWQVAYSGDINQDGQRDVVAYTETDITPVPDMEQYYDQAPLLAAQVVVVQEGSDGMPKTLLEVMPEGIRAGDDYLTTYQVEEPQLTPAAFFLGVDAGEFAPITLLPLNASGEGFAQGVAVYWNEERQAFRLVGPTGTPSPDALLVGPGWDYAHYGDINNDGRRDAVVYRPADMVPASSMQPYLVRAPVVAAEIKIVQEGPDYEPFDVLVVNSNGIWNVRGALVAYDTTTLETTPAAFLMGIDTAADAPLTVIPINAAGEGFAQGVRIYWDAGEQVYAIAQFVESPDPPTVEPTLAAPPTEVPPTEAPPTEAPPTEAPPTEAPPTDVVEESEEEEPTTAPTPTLSTP